jgi:hypothetical protein
MTSVGNPLTITIGVVPLTSSPTMLQNDVRLLKAAILYADRVRLYSLGASALWQMAVMANASPHERIQIMEVLTPIIETDPAEAEKALTGLRYHRDLGEKRNKSPRELIAFQQQRANFDRRWKALRESVDRLTEQVGAVGIAEALNSGMVELHSFKGRSTDELVHEYFEVVAGTLGISSSLPLFDEQTGHLIRSGIDAGAVTIRDSGAQRSREAGIAAYLLERLPLFEQATIDETLDIRTELSRPLIRFRQALVKYSEDIQDLPWGDDFQYEMELTRRKEIEPALLEIEEAIAMNRFLADLIRKEIEVLTKPTSASGPALAVVAGATGFIPQVAANAIAGVSIGLASAGAAYDAYREWEQQKQRAEGNQLFFYYRARERLARL